MEVLRFQASDALKPFVNHYSFINGWPDNAILHPLPNTNTELVWFSNETPEVIHTKDQSVFKSQVLLLGQLILHGFELRTPKQNLASFHIAFTPFGMQNLLNVQAREFRNVIAPAHSALPQFAHAFVKTVKDQTEPSQMAFAVDELLQKMIPEKLLPVGIRLQAVAQSVKDTKGMISIHKLRRESCLCEKVFVRSFFENSGLYPHEFCKIVRLNHVLHEIIQRAPEVTWYDIMEKYGYFDQSHFIKDVKKYTGRTPGALILQSNILCMDERFYLSSKK